MKFINIFLKLLAFVLVSWKAGWKGLEGDKEIKWKGNRIVKIPWNYGVRSCI